MVFFKGGGLGELIERVKMVESGWCGDWFLVLWGCGGYCKEGGMPCLEIQK